MEQQEPSREQEADKYTTSSEDEAEQDHLLERERESNGEHKEEEADKNRKGKTCPSCISSAANEGGLELPRTTGCSQKGAKPACCP
eukprot:6476101-Amphidinium_carterae.1